MLPGKVYDVDAILRILLDRIWLIIVPFTLCAALAVTIATVLPNVFLSETVIMLLPQRVPDTYVRSTVTDKLEARLSTLQSQILSRSRLERIILDLNLYVDLRATRPMEEVVGMMRKDITVTSESRDTFRVSYVSHDAVVAQKTAERLASLFIEENLLDREHHAEDTNDFLDSQLQDARRRLIEQEKKLEEYRRRYSGQLPSQATANLQATQNLQMQLQLLAEATNRARERRLLLERQIADLEQPDAPIPAAMIAAATTAPPDPLTQRLDAARAELDAARLRLKPTHPDLKILERSVRDLEQQRAAQAGLAVGADPTEAVAPPSAEELFRRKRTAALKTELTELDRELQDKAGQERHLRDELAAYQARLDAMPSRESDLVELTRDYSTLQASYQSLLAKREDAQLAANLERRNIGEQFKVLDPARVPERPFRPKRLLIVFGGAAVGLVIGGLLIGLLEYFDKSFKTEGDIERLCRLPVLAVLPVMTSAADRRRAATLRVAAIATVSAIGVTASVLAVMWRLHP